MLMLRGCCQSLLSLGGTGALPGSWPLLQGACCFAAALLPQVLQLRPCMAHLDKEREEKGGRKGSDAEMAAAEETKQELVALTVQVRQLRALSPGLVVFA